MTLPMCGLFHKGEVIVTRFSAILAFLALLPSSAFADEHQCLSEALYFEARDQGWRGMLAVGVVVQNRMRDSRYPSSGCGVVRQGRYWRGNPVKHLCQFSYWCDGKHERPAERAAWTMARNLAAMLLSTRIQVEGLGNATHYHTTSVWPPWSTRLRRQMQIGRHVFYVAR